VRADNFAVSADIAIRTETIDLDQFLKLAGVAESGGHAKDLIRSGAVQVNGTTETRRRATLKVGDVVTVDEREFRIVLS
jgi:ribosome-associated protein